MLSQPMRKMNYNICGLTRMLRVAFAILVVAVLSETAVNAEVSDCRARVKDVATSEGIRDNQLVGYGLVVGLRGTGDSSQTVFPAQTLISALERMGVTVPQTGSHPPPHHPGQKQ